MIRQVEKYPVLSLLLFVIVMLGFTVDNLPVSIMEARNFISAREMLTDGNWILTTMNGEARYEKPPLPTWITAFFGFLFGIKSVLALRWPALLFVAIVGISIYKLSTKMELNKSHSLINGFIVITSFYVIGITIEGPWDIYAHGFMLLALFNLFQLFKNQKTTLLNSILFIVFLACSILSKGPVPLYVLLLSFIMAYGIAYRLIGSISHFLKLFSLLIFGIALGGWWYFHVRIADPETFTAIATRETSNWSSYNVRPFYYYWSFFAQSGIWTIPALMSLLYPYMKTRVTNLKAYRFSFFWTIIAVILLSIIPEKKSRYLMPVLIPLAINIGFYLDYLIREFKSLKDKKETFVVYFQFGLIATVALLFGTLAFFLGPFNSGLMLVKFIICAVVLAIIGVLILVRLKQKKIKTVFYLTILFMLSLGLFALPLAQLKIQENYNPVSELANNSLPLYSLNYIAPEVIYNYGDKIPSISKEDGVLIPDESQFYVIATKTNPISIETLDKLYNIEYIKTYDTNFTEEGSKSHKSRLVNNVYKLTRKE
ncbi:ArnT family glycosyltransferase [Winogradskyella alexanderae]|uniref:Glycosyltransferase n=1 Tax=Winogradskyella alexanderae TaxID=2877123 RepID=A0ABS7XPS8_9FLAO|nr:glycosyltransferase [Winogradskyella alexanderae]MCA0132010.1 glycosyltransferase [Winogradskyella alexanderae]